ncbi:ornithine cyclodeaminase [Rhodovibrionaceae bacterium A322]
MVQFASVKSVVSLVADMGPEAFLAGLTSHIENDFKRWEDFEKTPRIASHSTDGVIELMPASDGVTYGFKLVNGHPKNTAAGLQTVTALGVLSDVATGYPTFISEMTVLTALRTAAMSALAAKHLARPNSKTMAMIGLGAQSEFQTLAFKTIVGIDTVRVYDIDSAATRKYLANMSEKGLNIVVASDPADAVSGADIITTVTADKRNATILSDNLVGAGVHINAIGGDCPGKTELQKDILLKSDIFVEFPEQTRIEGEIQQLDADHPVTELWQVITGQAEGRHSKDQITIFDSVGFAIEDVSALTYLKSLLAESPYYEELDLLAEPSDPRNLFGMITQQQIPTEPLKMAGD